MSAATLELMAENKAKWFVMDEPDELPVLEEPEVEPTTFADGWVIEDPLDELLSVLSQTGRGHEAEIIAKFLDDPEDRSLHRMFLLGMQGALAEDWDSPEDAIYDTL